MTLRIIVLTTCLICTTSSALAQYDIDWFTIDGGGATFSVGGGFQVGGTIGQPDAGTAMTGSGFEVIGGFWVLPPACPGDLNADQIVDLTDLSGLLSNFGTLSGATLAEGDLDGDGDVDLNDLTILLSSFGTSCT